MRDPEPHHPHGHLRTLIGVGMIHERTRSLGNKFIDKRLADTNRSLVQTTDAIHPIGQSLTMPMNGRGLGQTVGHKNPDTITLDHLDGGARTLAVVTPHINFEAGCHLAHDRLGDQMKLLDPVVHAIRQGPAIERHHGTVIHFILIGAPRTCCLTVSLFYNLWQTSQRCSTHRA